MHKSIIGLLAVLIFGSTTIYMSGSAAFAQSTVTLDLPIEKPIDTSVYGRIQEKNDRRREKTNFPDRDVKQQDNSTDPFHPRKPIIEENPDNSIGPNSKYRYP